MAQDDVLNPVQEEEETTNSEFIPREFDLEGAKSKQTVAVVDSKGTIIGTGIAKETDKGLSVTVDGVVYTFNDAGNPRNSAAQDYTLKMAISQMDPNESENISSTSKGYTRSVNEQGEVVYTEITDSNHGITIDALNARDQFAIQALRAMMDKVEDPSAVSKNEITHYCEAAYLWASYMMTESSKTRAVIKDGSSAQTTTKETIGYLDSNTDKLLNNLIVELEKTNAVEIDGQQSIYSERIVNPKLMAFLNNYVKDGSSTVGLKDVITAINSLKTAIEAQTQAISAQTTALNNQKTALDNIETAINNLELSPVINNNITIPENNGGE